MNLYVPRVCRRPLSRMKMLDLLELELYMVMSSYVGTGN